MMRDRVEQDRVGRSDREGVRGLSHRQPGRSGRHGGRLPRHRPVARPIGRAEGAGRGAREGRRVPSPVRVRVEARRVAGPPQRDPHPRGGRARRDPLHRHALRAGRRPAHAAARGRPARAGARGPADRPGGLRAGRGARSRPRASRRQAGERARDGGGSRVPDRLRAQQARRRRHRGHADRDGAGHARLHRAGADPRRDDRSVHGRLLARLHDHPPAHRPGAVHGDDGGGEAVGALLRAAAAAERTRARRWGRRSTRS